MGTRGKLGLLLTWLLELWSLRIADTIIVRGTVHKRLLSSKGTAVEVIQDGVEREWFFPMDVGELLRQHGLDDVVTVGVMGSLTWNHQREMCYGSEIVELLRLVRGLPVKGVIIGDGSGLAQLMQRARDCGVQDHLLFLGRIPYRDLTPFVSMIDICLSTQTNDDVGQVRTTGKLPIYLACGRHVLASRVGEAARILPEEMLVDYVGTNDPLYPQRLAQKIRSILEHPDSLHKYEVSCSLAKLHFDYAMLAQRLAAVLSDGARGK